MRNYAIAIPYVDAKSVTCLLELQQAGQLNSYPAFVVGVTLASFIDGRTGHTGVDQATLAARARLNVRTVRNGLRVLEKVGFVSTKIITGKSNIYTLTPAASCRGKGTAPGNNLPHPRDNTCRTPRQEVAALSIYKKQYMTDFSKLSPERLQELEARQKASEEFALQATAPGGFLDGVYANATALSEKDTK